MRRFYILILAIFSVCSMINFAQAADYHNAFLQNMRGQWTGKGEVVAGRYKGVKFSCSLNTPQLETDTDMVLNGSCRYGIFSQAIKAKIHRTGNSYKGNFNEGAKARGLDITAGQISKDQMVLELNRKDLQGSMIAELQGDDQLRITLNVKIEDVSVPVIGMNLTRSEPQPTVVASKENSNLAWLQ